MLLLGANPKGRFIEQHDIFFGVGDALKDLVDHIVNYWPEAAGEIHIDAWKTVTRVSGYKINVIPKAANNHDMPIKMQLFFLNLGGYKLAEFEEFHYKMLVVANDKMDAIKQAKQTAFFKHTGFKGAVAHIDDKYGIDVDNICQVDDILPTYFKERYVIQLSQAAATVVEDEIHLGYYKLNKLE